MKNAIYFVIGSLLMLGVASNASAMRCENECCSSECTTTYSETERWIDTSTVSLMYEEHVTEFSIEFINGYVVKKPRFKGRKCFDKNLYDQLYNRAYMNNGSYGENYISDTILYDSLGAITKCRNKNRNDQHAYLIKEYIKIITRSWKWAVDTSGYYVYDVSSLTICYITCNPCPQQEPIPEPTTMILFGTGLIGLSFYLRKK